MGFSLQASGSEQVFNQSADLRQERALARLLPAQPLGIGVPCFDQERWKAVASHFQPEIQRAEKYLSSPVAPWDDDAYLQFSRNGDRLRGEAMIGARNGPLSTLVLAECAEGQGRFLERIVQELDAVSAEPSWTLPAHDPKLENFHGTHPSIDLNAATLGHEVAETLYLLGSQIPKDTRERTMRALQLHVFRPFEQTLAGKDHQWWLTATNNWNAVCLDGVTGAALAVLPSRKRRTEFAEAAVHYQAYYLRSFRDSGYADEGIGYWSYGFSHYTDLRDVLWSETGGRVDLFDDPQAQRAARFGFDFAMFPGVYADFGDAHFMTEPDPALMARLRNVFSWADAGDEDGAATAFHRDLITAVAAAFPENSERRDTLRQQTVLGPRTYYTDVGVLVARPAESAACVAITIKAGGNSNHSHNDVGSYSIAMGETQIVGDPGGPLYYTADVFNAKRYKSPLLNSFGHPVPSINGALQLDVTKVSPRILWTDFTNHEDSMAIDMSAAYDTPVLRRLVRTMHYTRTGSGWIEIEDQFNLAHDAEIVESFPTHGT
ncbi:MAG TPA: hypothetical protein VFU86_00775, partial [Terriglobales bacterium]|nr:hypothetical protein [Terriglobales bacterium]